MSHATSPGKIILFGEHAVVYGQPAIAAPLSAVRASASVSAGATGGGPVINAVNLKMRITALDDAHQALIKAVYLALAEANQPENSEIEITLDSDIPIASGLGSGAAIAASTIKAILSYYNHPITTARLSELVYKVEALHHGTPSGIDNTVICYEKPVFFIRGQQPETFRTAAPFEIVIADTGIPSPTRVTVGRVREHWKKDKTRSEALFRQIGQICLDAYKHILEGATEALGPLMDDNQTLLEAIDVSSPELEHLISIARKAGALGAKLSGGGGGGNLIALVENGAGQTVAARLRAGGAVRTLITTIGNDDADLS